MQVSTIWCHLDPECALEARRRAIRVPGEFHEATSRRRLHSTAILEGQTKGKTYCGFREKPIADSGKNPLQFPGKSYFSFREDSFFNFCLRVSAVSWPKICLSPSMDRQYSGLNNSRSGLWKRLPAEVPETEASGVPRRNAM